MRTQRQRTWIDLNQGRLSGIDLNQRIAAERYKGSSLRWPQRFKKDVASFRGSWDDLLPPGRAHEMRKMLDLLWQRPNQRVPVQMRAPERPVSHQCPGLSRQQLVVLAAAPSLNVWLSRW